MVLWQCFRRKQLQTLTHKTGPSKQIRLAGPPSRTDSRTTGSQLQLEEAENGLELDEFMLLLVKARRQPRKPSAATGPLFFCFATVL